MPVTNVNQNPFPGKNHGVGAKSSEKVRDQVDLKPNTTADEAEGGKLELSEAGRMKASQAKLNGDAAETSETADKEKAEAALKELKGSAGSPGYLNTHKGISSKRVLDLLT